MKYDLKIAPEYYDAVANGIKMFEIFKDDRSYSVGDTLVLKEYDDRHMTYSGREITVYVDYIYRGELCKDGYCILSIAFPD